MRRRHHRRLRVEHERDAARAERVAVARHVRGELRRELAVDVRPVDAGLLEHRTVLEHTRYPTATSGPLPCIRAERACAIDISERVTDLGLQIVEELRGAIEEVRHACMLPSSITDDVGRDSPDPCDARLRGHLPQLYVAVAWARLWPKRCDTSAKWKKTHRRNARRMYKGFVRLRGVYIKLGQILSVMGTFLPREIRRGARDAAGRRAVRAVQEDLQDVHRRVRQDARQGVQDILARADRRGVARSGPRGAQRGRRQARREDPLPARRDDHQGRLHASSAGRSRSTRTSSRSSRSSASTSSSATCSSARPTSSTRPR